MIPALPPRPHRLRSLLLPLAAAGALAGGLGHLVRIWPAPEPFVVPRDRPTPVALVPMTTDAQYLGMRVEPQCLSVLDDFVRRPGWQLTLRSGVQGCVGESMLDTITVDAAGDAVWTGGGLPARPLHLTATQLAKLHAAAALSCEPPPDHVVDYTSWFVDLHWGPSETPALRVRESAARDQLAAFIDEAVDQYRSRRLAERAEFSATVAIPAHAILGMSRPMKVSFDARGALTIRAGRRTVSAETLDLAARVDAIDWIELGGIAALPVPPSLARALDRATFDAGMQPD